MVEFKDGIECVIKSCDEPQLDRAIDAALSQTIPFERVSNYNNIVPEFKAHNTILEKLQYEWAIWVDGDVILLSLIHI